MKREVESEAIAEFKQVLNSVKKTNIMEYSVIDPSTHMPFRFQAKPENLHGELGFRIIPQFGSSFFIANKFGVWRSLDDHKVDLELLERIGLCLEEGA